jgi:hypothetical protein
MQNFFMKEEIFKSDIHVAAAAAARNATKSLQKLVNADARVILANFEQFENPMQADAKELSERCSNYFSDEKIILSAALKVYHDNDIKESAGEMMMFLDQPDKEKFEYMLLSQLDKKESSIPGMAESSLTEALNVIGNAYIKVVAKYYNITLVSMVPKLVGAAYVDNFITELISGTEGKVVVVFDTELIITRGSIHIPFLLSAVIDTT